MRNPIPSVILIFFILSSVPAFSQFGEEAKRTPYVMPSISETRCLSTLDGFSEFVVPDDQSAYKYIGGGIVAHGPLKASDPNVYVALKDKEVVVDASTGQCSVNTSRSAKSIIERRFDLLLNALKFRAEPIHEGEPTFAERDAYDKIKSYLSSTIHTCSGRDLRGRETYPDWLIKKVVMTRREMQTIDQPRPVRNSVPNEEPNAVR